MKISLNWLKDYIDINLPATEIAKILTDTGLEVEGIEKFELVEGGLRGLVIGEVLTCEKHPNADKLSITTVDIGGETPSPIVCGAPNVAKRQKVIVATVGSTLYPTGHEPFTIKKAKIRGEVSEGMICAEDEIGIGTSHDGIMILNTDLPNGTPAAEYFDLSDDTIFEIGLTPNRADATSHIGVARDIKAVLKNEIKWPITDQFKADNNNLTIEVVVENTEACPRYSALTIANAKVTESPDWLKQKLLAIGQSPINNVVDITNYVLHEYGQPLHAFDADKIQGNKVLVKTLKEGTKFTTLDEKDRRLTSSDLMICDGESNGMCIAGVFGGTHSGVTEETRNIFLESAYFSADYIRKTAQYHQLKTDASFRFERGTDPNITVNALKRAALLIKEITGGEISSDIIDIFQEPIPSRDINVKFKNVDRLIGKSIDHDQIFEILNSLDIKTSNKSETGFIASVPPYRVDVEREADVIEEVLRIYGFNNVELPPFVKSDYLAEFTVKDADKLQKMVTELLVSNGYFEIITNSLTKPVYAERADNLLSENNVNILNKLSEDLGVMRQSLLYTGLEVVSYNVNRRQNNLKLFEFGKNYFHKEDKYKESRRLALYLTGDLETESWAKETKKVDFHALSAICNLIFNKMLSTSIDSAVTHEYPFEYGISYSLNGKELAKIGKVKSGIIKYFELKQEIFYADINWDLLLKKTSNNIIFEEVSKFPEVRRDLSLVIDQQISFDEIKKLTWQTEKRLIKNINVFDVYEGDKIDENKKAYAISFILQDTEKTLTDKIIDKTMNRLMSVFESELRAVIRK